MTPSERAGKTRQPNIAKMIVYKPDGSQLEIAVADDSYRLREIMANNMIMLNFAITEYISIPIGSYCEHLGTRYTLFLPPKVSKRHDRCFEYSMDMRTDDYITKFVMFRHVLARYRTISSGGESVTTMTGDGGDGRLSFPLTATPKEHLQMLVDNLNKRLPAGEQIWTIGTCIDWDGTEDTGTEKLISYEFNTCLEAIALIADTFETEFSFAGRSVSLKPVELFKENPLPISYGKGNGLKSGVTRQNSDSNYPIERLFVQGGDKNIDPSVYGSKNLHLPPGKTVYYDGTYFYGQEGYDNSKGVAYKVSQDGQSVTRADMESTAVIEGSFDATAIYPKRVGTVSSVVVVDEDANQYDIVDSSIPAALDYEDCLIAGEQMTIIFQTGMLAGREFDVRYFHNAVGGKAARRFEIVPAEQDGETMPGGNYLPAVGDKYEIFHCQLPSAYISNNLTQTGAEWEALRKAVVYLHHRSEDTYEFSGEIDGIWAKRNWADVGAYMDVGCHVMLTDSFVPPPGILLRITAIKDYINNPYSPQLTFSNALVKTSLFTQLIGLHNRPFALIEETVGRQVDAVKRLADSKPDSDFITYDAESKTLIIKSADRRNT